MKNDRLAWPILLLLLTVLVPSVGVVWMMREAVSNERLASDQRLREAYQVHLQSASQSVQDRWVAQLETSASEVDERNPARSFADIISRGDVDSVLIRDSQGRVVYPNEPVSNRPRLEKLDPRWREAQQHEFAEQQYRAAAEIYAGLAGDASSPIERARARQAHVRCLLKLGENSSAIEVLDVQRQQPGLCDEQGRSFAATAELQLLGLLERASSRWNEVARQLEIRLGDYQGGSLTSSQRQFLMTQLQQIVSEPVQWPTQAAEKLAAEAAAVDNVTFSGPGLQQTLLPGVWSRASSDGRVVELYRTHTIRKRLLQLTQALPLPRGVAFEFTAPGDLAEHLMDTSLGSDFGGWRLGLRMTQGDLFDQTSQQRRAVHVWIALLVIAVTCVLGWMLSSALRHRLRLAQLKNDLVATVSHELKTPLTSIRLLVDTLLESDDHAADEASRIQNREYLQLISHENARLTRLIDNFLTFSRMEQGMNRLDFRMIELRDVVDQAVTVFREHWGDVDTSLKIEEEPMAWVWGDLDSLVTAVVNLLENAWKYSDDQKQISLMIRVDTRRVTLAVRDNGIGLSARAASRIFDRFYQVDQRVARTRGGCGLGLSIVQAIMQAHGGEVRVKSEPNAGSTFTLCLPRPVTVNTTANVNSTVHPQVLVERNR